MKTKKNWKRHLGWIALSPMLLLAAGCQSGTESTEEAPALDPKKGETVRPATGLPQAEVPEPRLELAFGEANERLSRRHALDGSTGTFEAAGSVRYSGDADVLLLLVGPSAMSIESARLWGEGEAPFVKQGNGEWAVAIPQDWVSKVLESGSREWEGEVEVVAQGMKKRFPIRLRFSVPLPALSFRESKVLHGKELKTQPGNLARDLIDGRLKGDDFEVTNPSPFPVVLHLRYPSPGSLRQVTRIDEVFPSVCEPFPQCVPMGSQRRATYSEGFVRVASIRIQSSGSVQERPVPNDWLSLTLKPGETIRVGYRFEIDPASAPWVLLAIGGSRILDFPSAIRPSSFSLGFYQGWKLAGEIPRDLVLAVPGYLPQDLDAVASHPEEGKEEARVLTRASAEGKPLMMPFAAYELSHGVPLTESEWRSASPRMVRGASVIGTYQ